MSVADISHWQISLDVVSGLTWPHSGAFPEAAGGGKINPGLLTIEFRAGDKGGLYRPTFELIGGNSFQFTLEAQAPR